jgi:hypothetical protein
MPLKVEGDEIDANSPCDVQHLVSTNHAIDQCTLADKDKKIAELETALIESNKDYNMACCVAKERKDKIAELERQLAEAKYDVPGFKGTEGMKPFSMDELVKYDSYNEPKQEVSVEDLSEIVHNVVSYETDSNVVVDSVRSEKYNIAKAIWERIYGKGEK